MSDEVPRISTVGTQVEYYDDKVRVTNLGVLVEYDNFALTTVAVQVEYVEGESLLAVGQYYQAP
jgi:hypothetical protein